MLSWDIYDQIKRNNCHAPVILSFVVVVVVVATSNWIRRKRMQDNNMYLYVMNTHVPRGETKSYTTLIIDYTFKSV